MIEEQNDITTYDLIWDDSHENYSTDLPEQINIPNDRDECMEMDYLGERHDCMILHWFECGYDPSVRQVR